MITLLFCAPPARADGETASGSGGGNAISSHNLMLFEADSPEALASLLDEVWSVKRKPGTIPNVAPEVFPPGMNKLEVKRKKQAFFRALAPHVLKANLWIAYERNYLLKLLESNEPPARWSMPKMACVRGMARRYRVELGEPGTPEFDAGIDELVKRADVIPPALALAQAAIESGWGASRFTRLGNNLFGQWVFSAEAGIAPKERPKGANYSIARFDDLGQSVAAYLYNLNTFYAYADLRDIRAGLRQRGERIDSDKLAAGLINYSQRREKYVQEVRSLISYNKLHRYDEMVFSRKDEAQWEEALKNRGAELDLETSGLIAPFVDPQMLAMQ